MRAVSLWQPWASLVAMGAKTVETRSWRAPRSFNGTTIAIHAARTDVGFDQLTIDVPGSAEDAPTLGIGTFSITIDDGDWVMWDASEAHEDFADITLPFGVIVATARLVDSVPIQHHLPDIDEPYSAVCGEAWGQLGYHRFDGYVGTEIGQLPSYVVTPIEDQRPYGDFTPGRWAWILDDIEPVEPPVSATGRQGIWEWTP